MNYIKWGAALALLVAVFFAGYHVAAQAGRIKLDAVTQANAEAAQHVADLTTKASEAARDAEHKQAFAFDDIATKYEQDKAHAEADQARLVADLRAERVRLRAAWSCPAAGVPGTSASAGKPDAATEDRDESAARIVRAAADADAQIRALQAILIAERKP
jgi:hypothetical protein